MSTKQKALQTHMKQRIAPEVIERATWLESMGLDAFDRDGLELSVSLNWFETNCTVVGIPEKHAPELRAMFIRYAAPLMAKAKTTNETTA